MTDSLSALERMERAQAALIAKHAPGTTVRELVWSKGTTRVLELGEGPPLLLVHGGLGSSVDWIPALSLFARRHRVIVVDRPGHGFASAFDYRRVDLAVHGAEFLGEILDALEVPSATVVGSSIGGFLSVAFALAAPHRVTHLVLMGKPVGCNRRAPAPLRMLGAPIVGGLLARLLMSNPSPKANRKFWGDLLVADGPGLDEELIVADCAHQTHNLESMLGLIKRVAGPGGTRKELVLGERWAELSMPTLLLWGERDAFGGPDEAGSITERNTRARLVEVPDAGHMPWLDNPDVVAALLERFLGPAPARRSEGRSPGEQARSTL